MHLISALTATNRKEKKMFSFDSQTQFHKEITSCLCVMISAVLSLESSWYEYH